MWNQKQTYLLLALILTAFIIPSIPFLMGCDRVGTDIAGYYKKFLLGMEISHPNPRILYLVQLSLFQWLGLNGALMASVIITTAFFILSSFVFVYYISKDFRLALISGFFTAFSYQTFMTLLAGIHASNQSFGFAMMAMALPSPYSILMIFFSFASSWYFGIFFICVLVAVHIMNDRNKLGYILLTGLLIFALLAFTFSLPTITKTIQGFLFKIMPDVDVYAVSFSFRPFNPSRLSRFFFHYWGYIYGRFPLDIFMWTTALFAVPVMIKRRGRYEVTILVWFATIIFSLLLIEPHLLWRVFMVAPLPLMAAYIFNTWKGWQFKMMLAMAVILMLHHAYSWYKVLYRAYG